MDEVTLTIDGSVVVMPTGSTILDACRAMDNDQPTLCYLDNLTPVNVCRVCVVEVEGNRTLAPSCSRPVEEGMVVATDTDRVRHSRKMVYEFLASSVDMGLVDEQTTRWMNDYGCDPARYGRPAGPVEDRDERYAGHHHVGDGHSAETVHQPVKVDNELYVRDYSRCILCYKCVEACGDDAQHTFAIATAGRGFDAHISTEFDDRDAARFGVRLLRQLHRGVPDRCADAFKHRTRHCVRPQARGTRIGPDRSRPDRVLVSAGWVATSSLHTQDDRIVKVTSPADHSVTSWTPVHQGPVRLRIRPGNGRSRRHPYRRGAPSGARRGSPPSSMHRCNRTGRHIGQKQRNAIGCPDRHGNIGTIGHQYVGALRVRRKRGSARHHHHFATVHLVHGDDLACADQVADAVPAVSRRQPRFARREEMRGRAIERPALQERTGGRWRPVERF